MAVYAKHVTASGTAQTVTLTRPGKYVVVVNHHASQLAYFTVAPNVAGPTPLVVAVAAADDTYPVAAGSSTRVPGSGGQNIVSVIASGADTPVSVYTVDY
jgi:hypothetical protein